MNLRRITRDKRSAILPLVLLGVGNLAVYLLGVAPLKARVSAAERRAEQVAAEMGAAARQFEQARATVEGRSKATEQLRRFYEDVLPPDQAAARRLTYLDLARLANSAGLRVSRRTQSLDQARGSQLVRLDTSMALEGRYENVREFLYDIETASDFVVITDVALARDEQQSAVLMLTLGIATYFRPAP